MKFKFVLVLVISVTHIAVGFLFGLSCGVVGGFFNWLICLASAAVMSWATAVTCLAIALDGTTENSSTREQDIDALVEKRIQVIRSQRAEIEDDN